MLLLRSSSELELVSLSDHNLVVEVVRAAEILLDSFGFLGTMVSSVPDELLSDHRRLACPSGMFSVKLSEVDVLSTSDVPSSLVVDDPESVESSLGELLSFELSLRVSSFSVLSISFFLLSSLLLPNNGINLVLFLMDCLNCFVEFVIRCCNDSLSPQSDLVSREIWLPSCFS